MKKKQIKNTYLYLHLQQQQCSQYLQTIMLKQVMKVLTVAATQPAAQPTTQPTFQKEPKEISNKIPMTVSEYKQKSALELVN